MRLLLDEHAGDRAFVTLLREAGHNVETSVASLGVGASDLSILTHARENARVVITRDCADFLDLAAVTPEHSGLLLIFAGSIASASKLVLGVGRIEELFPSMDARVLSLVEFRW